MATKRRRPGDFSFGILNDIRDTKTGGKVNSGTSGLTVLRRATRDRYSPKALQGTGPYRAIVLRIDQKKDGSSKATNPDDASFPAYSVFSPSSTEKDNIPVVAIRARIPELDSHFPIPNKYGDEGSGPHQAKINMHTLFIAQDDLTEVPEPGSVVWVNFGGGPFNRTDPVYLGPVLRTQYAGQAGTIAAGAAGAPRSAFGAGCVSSMTSRAGSGAPGSTSSPLIVNSESPGPRGALVKPARPGGSVSEGENADPCIVANLKKNLNSADIPIDAWVGSLSGNGQREVIIFIPGTTDLSKKTELIYWIHGAGSYYTNNHSRKLPKEMSNMAKQGRNFILIHPAMPWGATKNANRPCPCKRCVTDQMKAAKCRKVELGGTMAFSDDGACGDLPKMHSEVLAILQNTYKATASEIFITIAAHSKGGYSASPSAKEVPYGFSRQLSNLKPDRITLADADYGFNSTKSIWDKYLSNISKKVEYNILVSNSQVISDKIPNNADQAKKLVRALGHEAPDNHRSWFGKHQVPLEKSAGHTIVYIGGERGGPHNTHDDVGYACISYEHSGGTTVKNNGNPDVESTSRDGLPIPVIEGPPSPTQVEASKKEDFDCVDLQKRLAASEQGLKITEERVKKYAKEIQALESVDIRATGQASRQKHNEKLENARDRLKASQENSPTIKQTVEKLKKEAETYRFHPNCRKLEKTKPAVVGSSAIVVAPSRQIILPSSGCGGTVTTVGTPGTGASRAGTFSGGATGPVQNWPPYPNNAKNKKTCDAPQVHSINFSDPVLGVDVSNHNKGLNYADFKNSGVKFAIVKTSEGSNSNIARAQEHISGFIGVGVPVGVYHFAHPARGDDKMDWKEEADAQLASLRHLGFFDGRVPANLRLIPFLDVEHLSIVINRRCGGRGKPPCEYTLKGAPLVEWLENFLDYMESNIGVRPGGYMGRPFLHAGGIACWRPRKPTFHWQAGPWSATSWFEIHTKQWVSYPDSKCQPQDGKVLDQINRGIKNSAFYNRTPHWPTRLWQFTHHGVIPSVRPAFKAGKCGIGLDVNITDSQGMQRLRWR